MGWYYLLGASRASLIRELTKPRDNENCTGVTLRHCTAGNVLWTVNEITFKNNGDKKRYIGCDLLHPHKDGWGYKSLEEGSGPGHYTCPLSYLADVPEVADATWREGVKRYWEERKDRLRQKRARSGQHSGRSHA